MVSTFFFSLMVLFLVSQICYYCFLFTLFLRVLRRYKHPNPKCYTRSELLVAAVYAGLERSFKSIIQHLFKIREVEGVAKGEGCMGGSPFTGVSITRDYNCSVHNDANDFSYSFFIWLGDGTLISSLIFCCALLISSIHKYLIVCSR